jgi:hypothetical protein
VAIGAYFLLGRIVLERIVSPASSWVLGSSRTESVLKVSDGSFLDRLGRVSEGWNLSECLSVLALDDVG